MEWTKKEDFIIFFFLIFLGVNGEERRAERSRLLSPLGFWLKLLWPTRHGMLSYTLHLALSLSCLYYTLMSCSSRWFCCCFCFLSFSAWIMVHFLLFKKKIYGKERKRLRFVCWFLIGTAQSGRYLLGNCIFLYGNSIFVSLLHVLYSAPEIPTS